MHRHDRPIDIGRAHEAAILAKLRKMLRKLMRERTRDEEAIATVRDLILQVEDQWQARPKAGRRGRKTRRQSK
jgi:hypothetical protein